MRPSCDRSGRLFPAPPSAPSRSCTWCPCGARPSERVQGRPRVDHWCSCRHPPTPGQSLQTMSSTHRYIRTRLLTNQRDRSYVYAVVSLLAAILLANIERLCEQNEVKNNSNITICNYHLRMWNVDPGQKHNKTRLKINAIWKYYEYHGLDTEQTNQ